MSGIEDCTIHTYVLASLLAVIVVLFFWDTIRNFLQIIRAVLGPYFIPQEDVSLLKKYGPWACKYLLLYFYSYNNVNYFLHLHKKITFAL